MSPVASGEQNVSIFNTPSRLCLASNVDDDIHLLDADDVETIVADANEGNDIDVEDDVWSTAVARLGLRNEKPVWGYVGPETEQPVPSYLAYEPPSRMYDVNYTEMRDREHQARVFGSSSSSNYGELVLKAQLEMKKEAKLAGTK
ncbi:hypothetical protein V6N13_029972 [Hibiscus sabdariffa]